MSPFMMTNASFTTFTTPPSISHLQPYNPRHAKKLNFFANSKHASHPFLCKLKTCIASIRVGKIPSNIQIFTVHIAMLVNFALFPIRTDPPAWDLYASYRSLLAQIRKKGP
eukprot:TRINITY_DN5135_c3_g1_i1.p1 TRINITY_DN5135_c3_g1~~TRINITY_DN5135_c3_g1_i1.p1  ORF type:complete len:111 (+),score=7.35 TRINITY_DN5135_c3_g1_i1:1610-1942(+)